MVYLSTVASMDNHWRCLNLNSDERASLPLVRNLQCCYHYHMRKLTGHPFDQGVAQVMMMMMYYSWKSMVIETIGHPGDP